MPLWDCFDLCCYLYQTLLQSMLRNVLFDLFLVFRSFVSATSILTRSVRLQIISVNISFDGASCCLFFYFLKDGIVFDDNDCSVTVSVLLSLSSLSLFLYVLYGSYSFLFLVSSMLFELKILHSRVVIQFVLHCVSIFISFISFANWLICLDRFWIMEQR